MGLCWKKMRNLVKLKDTESLYLQLQGVSLCISCRLEQYGRNLVEYGLILDIVHCWHVSGLAASLGENAQIMGNLTNNENMEKCGGFDQEVHTSRTWPGTYRTGFSSWNEQQDNLLETQIFPRPSLAVCHLSHTQAAGVDLCPRARPMLASLYLSRRMPVVRLSSLQSCLTADR